MVSPGNTYVCLTEPGGICKPNSRTSTALRHPQLHPRRPEDAVQMAGLATFANEQGIHNPFILVAADDPTSRARPTRRRRRQSLGMDIAASSSGIRRRRATPG
jgi:hypothetical protein